MKLIYLGSDVYLDTFKYLVENHEVLALYTYHNDEDYFMDFNIVSIAHKYNIPIYYEPLSKDEIYHYFNDLDCELIFSAEYAHIIDLPDDINNLRAINIHGSYLPKGRSYYPIECGFDLNEEEIGVTIHKMVNRLDAGDIIYQEKFSTKNIDSIDAYILMSKLIYEFTIKLMNNFNYYYEHSIKQESKLPYWKKPTNLIITCDDTINSSLDKFRKYNKLLTVNINDKTYYVISLNASKVLIDHNILLDKEYCLFKVKDGHLRLALKEKKDV